MYRRESRRSTALYCGAIAFALAASFAATPARAGDPFADAVEDVDIGMNGGFGSDLLPGVVIGPPRGAGLTQGSFDVLALGVGGSVIVRFDEPFICDGPGVDFTIFENAFHSGSPEGPIFDELGFVSVSQDGETFFDFPHDVESMEGLAGRTPVESHPDNGISATDPAVSGGDSFDLSDVGLPWARYVRITDVAGEIPDVGDLPPFRPAPNAGFDLDAVAAVHVCSSQTATPTPTTIGQPAATATLPQSEATATATPVPPSSTPTATPGITGDLNGDGRVTGDDVAHLIGELFDGDGDAVSAAGGGMFASDSTEDVNRDLHITAGDLVAISALRTE